MHFNFTTKTDYSNKPDKPHKPPNANEAIAKLTEVMTNGFKVIQQSNKLILDQVKEQVAAPSVEKITHPYTANPCIQLDGSSPNDDFIKNTTKENMDKLKAQQVHLMSMSQNVSKELASINESEEDQNKGANANFLKLLNEEEKNYPQWHKNN